MAERLGGRRQGLTVHFDDGSELDLVPLREELGHRDLIRLPPKEEADTDVDRRERPARDQLSASAISLRSS